MSDPRRVTLVGEVDEEQSSLIIKRLNNIDDLSPDSPIDFIINSQGGSTVEGSAIFSHLLSMSVHGGGKHYVRTIVRGMCGSIATLILQAGDVRLGGAMDVLVFHEARMYLEGESLESVKARVEQLDQWEAQYHRIVSDRSRLTVSEVQDLCTGPDTYLTGLQALNLGLLDWIG